VGRDRGSALGLAVFAVVYLLADRRYPLDTLSTPGPGLFPLLAGLALLALAGWQFAIPDRRPDHAPAAVREPSSARAPLAMAGVLVIYAALLPVVGFMPGSFALVVVSARLMGLRRWWAAATLALGVVLASRVVFVTWLGVPLP
jgi:hypothetical protein